MNRAHAFWSFGFFSAGLLGAGLSQLGVTPQAHLGVAVALVWLGSALILGCFEAAPDRSAGSAGIDNSDHSAAPLARFAGSTAGVMLLVAVTLSALVLEGAGAEWSAIYMRDVFGAGPFIAGAAVATGAFAQAVTRYVADGFVEQHQPVGAARVLLGVLGAGTVWVFAAPAAWTGPPCSASR